MNAHTCSYLTQWRLQGWLSSYWLFLPLPLSSTSSFKKMSSSLLCTLTVGFFSLGFNSFIGIKSHPYSCFFKFFIVFTLFVHVRYAVCSCPALCHAGRTCMAGSSLVEGPCGGSLVEALLSEEGLGRSWTVGLHPSDHAGPAGGGSESGALPQD